MNTAVRAKAMAIALGQGFASPHEVVAWVDGLIVDSATTDPSLADASLSERDLNGLISALERFAEKTCIDNMEELWAMVLGEFNLWFSDHPRDGPAIARVLFRMAQDGEVPGAEAEAEMGWFDDAYDLAIAGIHGRVERVEAELRVFLAQYANNDNEADLILNG